MADDRLTNPEYVWNKLQYDHDALIEASAGTGKTYAAACVANELLEKGFSVHMTDFSRVINTLWDLKEGKQKYLDRLNEYDLLIIDDLAASVTRLMPMRSS